MFPITLKAHMHGMTKKVLSAAEIPNITSVMGLYWHNTVHNDGHAEC